MVPCSGCCAGHCRPRLQSSHHKECLEPAQCQPQQCAPSTSCKPRRGLHNIRSLLACLHANMQACHQAYKVRDIFACGMLCVSCTGGNAILPELAFPVLKLAVASGLQAPYAVAYNNYILVRTLPLDAPLQPAVSVCMIPARPILAGICCHAAVRCRLDTTRQLWRR